MSNRKSTSAKVRKASDTHVVDQALVLIEAIPASLFPNEALNGRGTLQAQLKESIKPIYPVLERLQAEIIPESSSSGPLACPSGPRGHGTPITNFLACFDLCVHCHEEAKRALRAIQNALRGDVVPGPFLSPEEKVARAKQYEAWARDDQLRRAKQPKPSEFLLRSMKSSRERAAAQMPVLNEDASVFRDILLKRGPKDALTGPRLCDLYERVTGKAMDDAEFRTSIVPLLKAWGLKNKRKVGYYFPAGALARPSG